MSFKIQKPDSYFSKQGSVIPFDKVEHFILGFLVCFIHPVASFLLGLGWEIRDGFITGFSVKDFVANILGLMLFNYLELYSVWYPAVEFFQGIF